MSMSYKDFTALARAILNHNAAGRTPFTADHLATLADFCEQQNAAFKRDRWFSLLQ